MLHQANEFAVSRTTDIIAFNCDKRIIQTCGQSLAVRIGKINPTVHQKQISTSIINGFYRHTHTHSLHSLMGILIETATSQIWMGQLANRALSPVLNCGRLFVLQTLLATLTIETIVTKFAKYSRHHLPVCLCPPSFLCRCCGWQQSRYHSQRCE